MTYPRNADDIDADVTKAARNQLKSFVERLEFLDGEIKDLNADKKDVYGEAKANGYDPKILRKILAIRRQGKDERMEQEAILHTYLVALGMADEDE
jgi:uncharacterized protein (UPF0335 family)